MKKATQNIKLFFVLFLCFITFPIVAQQNKDSLLKQDVQFIFEELKFMYDYDQALRKYPMYKTFDTHFIDSIEKLPQTEIEKFKKENKIQSDTLDWLIHTNYIQPFDKIHTQRLLEITKKYGFPTVNRMNAYLPVKIKGEFNPIILLLHSPKQYWEELIPLMTNEYKLGTIDRCTYGYIMWHFHGRKDMSYLLNNGYKMTNENGVQGVKAVDCGEK
jgi:hypothetical protein